MRTFLRISLLGNAFLDLACILLLVHSSGSHRPKAAFSSEAGEKNAAVDRNGPVGVLAGEMPFVSPQVPEFHSAVTLEGSTMPAELAQLGRILKYTTAYEVDGRNWRFEGASSDTCLSEGAYPKLSP
jgi:hypothetical protein